VSHIERVCDGVERLSLATPTLPPATETNTYFLTVGRAFVVVEPATPYEAEQRVLLDAIRAKIAAGFSLTAAVITHHHADHVGAAMAVRDAFGVRLLAHRETAARLAGRVAVDATLDEGDGLLDDSILALHTPGHAPGHLCLRERTGRWLIAGDMVASVGTIVIDPEDGGDMREYLREIARLADGGPGIVLPAHGAPIEQGAERLRYYLAHRLAREAKVLAAVGDGATEDEVLARAYDEVPQAIWPIARRSARAHLFKLEAEGAIERDGPRWRPAG
jgi:ribonuclease/clavin/mitogillin